MISSGDAKTYPDVIIEEEKVGESSKSSKAVGILLETTDVEAILPTRDF